MFLVGKLKDFLNHFHDDAKVEPHPEHGVVVTNTAGESFKPGDTVPPQKPTPKAE